MIAPDELQRVGRDIANALWDEEGIPFDGYVIYREGNRVIIRIALKTDSAGRQVQVCTSIPANAPSIKPVVQALRFYAEGALS